LHGYGSNAKAFHYLWKSVTDTMGFVLLTPQGDTRTENAMMGLDMDYQNQKKKNSLQY
jgi:hypothetical protein